MQLFHVDLNEPLKRTMNMLSNSVSVNLTLLDKTLGGIVTKRAAQKEVCFAEKSDLPADLLSML